MRRARIGAFIVQLAALSAASAQAGALSRATEALLEVGAPPQGEAQWIAKSMRMNGLPMTLKSFHSRLSADAVLQHYESWARTKGNRQSVRSRNGDWDVLAIQAERSFISIQARTALNGSHGTIAVSAILEDAALTVETAFPIPQTASIVNLQQYDDFGMESEHISLSSARAPHVEAWAFSELLARDGWQLVREQPTNEVARGYVIEAQKGAQHAQLTFLPDQSSASMTAVLIVWKKT